MPSLKRLISEIHRRSLWQVLLIYVGAGWVVFQIVQTVTEGLGLPQYAEPDRLFEPFSLTAFLPMNHPVPCRCQSLTSPPTRGTNPLRRSKQWADH